MKKTVLVLSALLLTGKIFSQTALFSNAGQYAGVSGGTSEIFDMFWKSPGVGGNIYATGVFTGSVDFDMGTGTTTLTSNGGADIFISCQSDNGSYQWVIGIGGTGSDTALKIEEGPDGHLYIAGEFSDAVDFDAGSGVSTLTSSGGTDAFLLKCDILNGQFMWAKQVASGTGNETANCIAFFSDSSIAIGGNYEDTTDLNPGAGVANFITTGYTEVYISRLTASGNYQTAWSFDGNGFDGMYSLVVNTSDHLFALGYFEDEIDLSPDGALTLVNSTLWPNAFIVRFDTTGATLDYGTFDTHLKMGMVYDAGTQRLFVAGTLQDSLDANPGNGTWMLYGNVPGFRDVFVINLVQSLTPIETGIAGGANDDTFTSIGNSANYIAIGGRTQSVIFDAAPALNDSLMLAGTGNDLFAIAINGYDLQLQNSGLASDVTGSRDFRAIDCNYEAAGFVIHGGGSFNDVVDFDPAGNYTLSTPSFNTEAFIFKWGVCAPISVGTSMAVCDTFYFHNNVMYPVPGAFYDTLQSVCGSDSLVTTNLYLYIADTSVATNGFTLSSNQSGQLYQWVDCNNNFAAISGATNQNFSPAIDGSYAVVISNGTCYDTSGCHTILGIGINENAFGLITVSPNPFAGTLQISGMNGTTQISVYNILGEAVISTQTSSTTLSINTEQLPQGTYLLTTESAGKKNIIRVVK